MWIRRPKAILDTKRGGASCNLTSRAECSPCSTYFIKDYLCAFRATSIETVDQTLAPLAPSYVFIGHISHLREYLQLKRIT